VFVHPGGTLAPKHHLHMHVSQSHRRIRACGWLLRRRVGGNGTRYTLTFTLHAPLPRHLLLFHSTRQCCAKDGGERRNQTLVNIDTAFDLGIAPNTRLRSPGLAGGVFLGNPMRTYCKVDSKSSATASRRQGWQLQRVWQVQMAIDSSAWLYELLHHALHHYMEHAYLTLTIQLSSST